MSRDRDVLLLHGWGYHAGVWRATETAARANTIAMDLPGYGSRVNSAIPQNLDTLAEDLLQRAPQKAIWVGWSLGGLAAIRAAALSPERVEGLLLICTTPKFVASPDWQWGMQGDQFEAFVAGLNLEYQRNLIRFMLLQCGDSREARRLRKPISEVLASAPTPSLHSLIVGLDILRSADLRARLKTLSMPVRLIAGKKDQVCQSAASQWMARQTGAKLCELDCSHFPVLTHPEEIANQLSELIAELEA